MAKRILMIAKSKYKYKETYQGFDIYTHVTPDGIEIYNEWLLHKDLNPKLQANIVIQSYNNICYDELLDSIDNYSTTGVLGFNAFEKENYTVVHPNGDERL